MSYDELATHTFPDWWGRRTWWELVYVSFSPPLGKASSVPVAEPACIGKVDVLEHFGKYIRKNGSPPVSPPTSFSLSLCLIESLPEVQAIYPRAESPTARILRYCGLVDLGDYVWNIGPQLRLVF
jgi:hypothetical protein